MAYESITDLPDDLRESLPKPAQEIYQGAYNNAWEEFQDPKDRRDDSSKDEICHQVAINAVREQYKKEDGKWVKKN